MSSIPIPAAYPTPIIDPWLAAGQKIDRNIVFFEYLQNTDMRNSKRGSSTESHTNGRPQELPGQPAERQSGSAPAALPGVVGGISV